jgi:hypothetical protein
MTASAPKSPATLGHNQPDELDRLEKEAKRRQVEAQRAWRDLLGAQIDHHQPWVKILRSATRSGVGADAIRTAFKVSPPTWSRWLSGGASPSLPLRERLSRELRELAAKLSGIVSDK